MQAQVANIATVRLRSAASASARRDMFGSQRAVSYSKRDSTCIASSNQVVDGARARRRSGSAHGERRSRAPCNVPAPLDARQEACAAERSDRSSGVTA